MPKRMSKHTFLFQNTNYQKASFFGRFFFYQFGSKKNYQKTEILRVYQCFFMKKINEKRPLKPQKFLGAFGAECAHLIFLSKIAQIFLVDYFWYIFFGSKKSTKKRKIANYQIGRFFLPKKKVCPRQRARGQRLPTRASQHADMTFLLATLSEGIKSGLIYKFPISLI